MRRIALLLLLTTTNAFGQTSSANKTAAEEPHAGSWSEVHGPITPHFEKWLTDNGYGSFDYARRDFGVYGSYGGKQSDGHVMTKTPIVFVHGNEDGALAVPGNYTSGSSAQIACFEAGGYTSAELYVTTWGQRDSEKAMTNDHSCEHLLRLRKFIYAVMGYTKSRRVNIIAHSMGVTMARKVVKGGRLREYTGNTCYLGPPLTHNVGVFIGIAGANLGMCACMGNFSHLPTCNSVNGFYPGDVCNGANYECHHRHVSAPCLQGNYSRLLKEMNEDGIREGQKVYSFWTIEDDIIMNNALVWGRPTSLIPNSIPFVFRDLSHMETKESTCELQQVLLAPYATYNPLLRPRFAWMPVILAAILSCLFAARVIVFCCVRVFRGTPERRPLLRIPRRRDRVYAV